MTCHGRAAACLATACSGQCDHNCPDHCHHNYLGHCNYNHNCLGLFQYKKNCPTNCHHNCFGHYHYNHNCLCHWYHNFSGLSWPRGLGMNVWQRMGICLFDYDSGGVEMSENMSNAGGRGREYDGASIIYLSIMEDECEYNRGGGGV